jgi:hypothetical protein
METLGFSTTQHQLLSCVSLDIQAHDIYDISNSLPAIFDLAGTTSLKPNACGCGRI